jgi:mRNA interferase RelE/StbE
MPGLWKLKETLNFKEGMLKLQANDRQRIRRKLENLVALPEPRDGSKTLTGNLSGYRSLRVGDYRVLILLDEQALEVAAIAVGHRRNVYR